MRLLVKIPIISKMGSVSFVSTVALVSFVVCGVVVVAIVLLQSEKKVTVYPCELAQYVVFIGHLYLAKQNELED